MQHDTAETTEAPAADRPAATSLVELSGLTKSYGSFVAVHELERQINKGEFVAILGPSGCGKTTLLRMIGGFVKPSSGTIRIGGADVTAIPPEHRPTNMVFQGYGLFPHMTVSQNIGYGLRLRKTPSEEIRRRVEEAMELVHLHGFGDRNVEALSGGQAQRVALARALIMQPDVLMLDEPLAALDLSLRKSMQEELRRIHAATGGTFVFVTHDQEEAMSLATRILVMEGGKIVQDGPPEEIYSHPSTRFVSGFIGEANVLSGSRSQGLVTLEGDLRFRHDGNDASIACVIRPEKLRIRDMGNETGFEDCDMKLEGLLEDAVFLGPYVKYTVNLASGEVFTIDSRDMAMRARMPVGSNVEIAWNSRDQHILDEPRP